MIESRPSGQKKEKVNAVNTVNAYQNIWAWMCLYALLGIWRNFFSHAKLSLWALRAPSNVGNEFVFMSCKKVSIWREFCAAARSLRVLSTFWALNCGNVLKYLNFDISTSRLYPGTNYRSVVWMTQSTGCHVCNFYAFLMDRYIATTRGAACSTENALLSWKLFPFAAMNFALI